MKRFTSLLTRQGGLSRFDRATGSIAAIALSATLGIAGATSNLLDKWDAMDQMAYSRLGTAQPIVPVVRVELAKPETVQAITALSAANFKASVARIKNVFSAVGYSLEAVRSGEMDVPRIRYAALPHDLSEIYHAKERKAVFLSFMLPYVLEANNRVREQRYRIETLRGELAHGEDLDPVDAKWLTEKFEEYQVKPGKFSLLLRRVDIIPPSLALAQSAIESGWGTSRFAQEGNAAFGQWTTSAHKGIVPKNRDSGKEHRIRAFDDIQESVDSYMRNINTHRAYTDLRKLRAAQRRDSGTVDSIRLASGLSRYSEKGSKYVELLRQIIAGNKLRGLDRAQLSNTVVAWRPDA